MNKSCPECGFPVRGNEQSCPECGYPLQSNEENAQSSIDNEPQAFTQTETPESQQFQTQQPPRLPINSILEKKDWANYIYECGVIMWNVFCHNFANPYGRASRREYWSFTLITTCLMPFGLFLILLIPWICVSIRRMHDIDHCGWWSCVPFACFFMYLKKSDEGENRYGMPNPAKNMIY